MGWQLFRDREDEVGDDVDDDPSRPSGPLHEEDASFWASPVGRAARARLRGDRYFQIELDDVTLAAYAESAAVAEGGRRARRTCDLLGQIEELGWHLEHVSWWRLDPGATAPPIAEATQAQRSGSDSAGVRGVYLFHSEPVPDEDPPSARPSTHVGEHAPTHRRDVD